jgi:hypothetical protein
MRKSNTSSNKASKRFHSNANLEDEKGFNTEDGFLSRHRKLLTTKELVRKNYLQGKGAKTH